MRKIGKRRASVLQHIDLAPDRAGRSHRDTGDYENIWGRLFDMYALPDVQNAKIDRELAWFVNHPDYLDRVQKRAGLYLYNIVEQLDKHDLPGEIALLPVIESAFHPHAHSPADAEGIWQFIPSTGRRYGLKQTEWYDGRRDVYASTKAAIKYLKKLHDQFDGDWLLAIAAYNCGEGGVERAIQRNLDRHLPTDFWSLDLPQETRAYVPRLLAVARLFEDAEHYGIERHDIPNSAVFRPIKVETQIDLNLAADIADISLDELYQLNPGFKRKATDPNGPHRIMVPADRSKQVRAQLAKMTAEQLMPRGRRSSDVPEAVADESFVAVNESSEAKPLNSLSEHKARRLSPTRDLSRRLTMANIDQEHDSGSRSRNGAERFVKSHNGPVGRIHDSLHQQAEDHVKELKISGRSGKRGGESESDDAGTQSAKSRQSYSVKPGDTLWSISSRFGVDVEDVKKWNRIPKSAGVKSGQTLVIVGATKDTTSKKIDPSERIVSKGKGQEKSVSTKGKALEPAKASGKKVKVTLADAKKVNGRDSDKNGKSSKKPRS